MKKLITLLFLVPMMIFGQEKKSQGFFELNVGVALIDSYDYQEGFVVPGLSCMWGKTQEFGKNGVFEYQLGIAIPSVVTGKFALGVGDLNRNIGIAVRPWPFSVGPQAKLGNLSLSFEVGTNETASLYSGYVSTIGYRWNLRGRNKKSKNENQTDDSVIIFD